ncbi:hypothetical protein [Novosphingobium sp. YAF33]|jgi:hypothetical protein|uniref:hypothetical protein n=1 Tax=Novosphingobium sp. YAF33 TaxID=3233082 RepID=UPI003F9D4B72
MLTRLAYPCRKAKGSCGYEWGSGSADRQCGGAGLFALSYFLIARISRGQRPVIAFGVSYLLGMVTPISEIAIRLTDYPAPFMLASYMALLGGFLAMAAALSIFHRKRPAWTAIATLAVLGLITRIAIWGGTRDDLIYELAFQLPLALGFLLCSHTAFRTGKGQLNHTLAGLFLLSGLNFFIKPFVAAAVGSGQTARDYAGRQPLCRAERHLPLQALFRTAQ